MFSYPESANVYDSLGDAYEANNQLAEALRNYSIAFELGQKTTDTDVSIYKSNIARVREKLLKK